MSVLGRYSTVVHAYQVLSTARAAVLAAVEQRALPFYSSNSFLSSERLHR